jgi:hypothetical protein
LQETDMANGIDQASAIKPNFEPDTTQVVGIMVAGQPMCLGVGLQNGSASYVSVITARAGAIPRWRIQYLSSGGGRSKVFIVTEDGQNWWSVPSDQPFPNCVAFGPQPTKEAPYQPGGFMAPTGSARGFYFATNAAASAQLYFVAVQ